MTWESGGCWLAGHACLRFEAGGSAGQRWCLGPGWAVASGQGCAGMQANGWGLQLVAHHNWHFPLVAGKGKCEERVMRW